MDRSGLRRSLRAGRSWVTDFSVFNVSGWSSMEGVEGEGLQQAETHEDIPINVGEVLSSEAQANMADTEVAHMSQGGTSRGNSLARSTVSALHSRGGSPIRVNLPGGSDSTVSNPDLGSQGDGGSEDWRVQKVTLVCKLQKAKECEKVLKAKLSAQKERIRLELQEKENQRLEFEIRQRELDRECLDREQECSQFLQAERNKIEEGAREQLHQFQIEQERLKADIMEKHQLLQHEIKMQEIEVEQFEQEKQLEQKLMETRVKRAQLVRSKQDDRTGEPERTGTGNLRRGPVTPTPPLRALVDSGATLLTEVGLDQNTTEFIMAQALKAKAKGTSAPSATISHATSAQRELGSSIQMNADTFSGTRDPVAETEDEVAGLLSSDITWVVATNNMADGGLAVRPVLTSAAVGGDPDSDGESVVSVNATKKKLKSGMVALPTDNIKTPQIWPHYNLTYGYVTAAIQFQHITFEQYVVGETKTILNAQDSVEKRGQLLLMSRIAYLKQKGHPWGTLRTLYAAIVNAIEKHESSWASEWRDIEDMVLDSVNRMVGPRKGVKVEQWYCRNFNRSDGCQIQPPHEAMIGKKCRQVRHFCAKCWINEQEFRDHGEHDEACPHKE